MKLVMILWLLLAVLIQSASLNAQYLSKSSRTKILYHVSGRTAQPGSDVGIREIVPREFQDRFEKWKSELLSTEFGREQWNRYAGSDTFLLKIVVSPEKKFGAGTGDFRWDDDGRLIGATITLGKNLDRGFPDPIYYPVMNSLSLLTEADDVRGNILASTKIAHEFGHVDLAAQTDGTAYQQEEKLMNAYYKIFLVNGYNTRDPRLVELAGHLGRQPIEIWEDREYWGEANAMRFLIGRINKEDSYCAVLENIKRNVTVYARNYEERFDQIAESNIAAGCRY